jgi:hypothetical protein
VEAEEMSPRLIGWLVLMARYDGVEMVCSPRVVGTLDEGWAHRIEHERPRAAHWAWCEGDESGDTRRGARAGPADHHDVASERAPYDDGTVSK